MTEWCNAKWPNTIEVNRMCRKTEAFRHFYVSRYVILSLRYLKTTERRWYMWQDISVLGWRNLWDFAGFSNLLPISLAISSCSIGSLERPAPANCNLFIYDFFFSNFQFLDLPQDAKETRGKENSGIIEPNSHNNRNQQGAA